VEIMRRSNRSIVQQIVNVSLATGLGAVTLFGGVAHAETVQQRAQAAMNNGQDYVAAQQTAARELGSLYVPEVSADWKSVETALNQGKDYIDAVGTTSRRIGAAFAPEQVARAQLADEALSQGEDYAAAWNATDEEQPTRTEPSRSAEVTAKRDVARSKQ
jgi:hypothetical protein